VFTWTACRVNSFTSTLHSTCSSLLSMCTGYLLEGIPAVLGFSIGQWSWSNNAIVYNLPPPPPPRCGIVHCVGRVIGTVAVHIGVTVQILSLCLFFFPEPINPTNPCHPCQRGEESQPPTPRGGPRVARWRKRGRKRRRQRRGLILSC